MPDEERPPLGVALRLLAGKVVSFFVAPRTGKLENGPAIKVGFSVGLRQNRGGTQNCGEDSCRQEHALCFLNRHVLLQNQFTGWAFGSAFRRRIITTG
ncbi:hypothetical protein CSW23_00040 [Thermus scotoductus]|uniref:Uncharacterized protein n=1 Tax=Thermus scotoductus TaxID=37636 RepID=A0A430QVD9_THESC|nr:hypothetical protein CSW50_14090 [Thermus scotoductus]RTI21033.1 hypothetical protein CSW23_00040 [Thermus scotoductus]